MVLLFSAVNKTVILEGLEAINGNVMPVDCCICMFDWMLWQVRC